MTTGNASFFSTSGVSTTQAATIGELLAAIEAGGGALPVGGTTGQVLAKINATNYNVQWITAAGLGDALVASPLSQFAATTSLQLKNTISDETGSGALVFANTPTLVTPVLGVATATSINGATITSGTLNGSVTGTNTGDQSAASILASLLTVDGAGSGLDADLLDGSSSAAFAAASHTHVQADITGLTTADSPQLTGINLGHATDTTIARVSAGVVSIEGSRIQTVADSGVINCTIDGGGSAITTGIKGDIGPFPFACTIQDVTLLGDQSGSIVIDIWKDSYANFPPTVADTITAAAKPTITATTKSQDTTLTGWSTGKNIAVGDILRFNVDSVTSFTMVQVAMKVLRT